MTLKELLTFFEGFYGEKYTGVLLDTMVAYLDGSSSDFYRATACVIVKRVSRNYGKVPGPAEIEQHMTEILDTLPKWTFLPEPQMSAEERDKAREALCISIEEFRQRLKNRPAGPMARLLSSVIDTVGK